MGNSPDKEPEQPHKRHSSSAMHQSQGNRRRPNSSVEQQPQYQQPSRPHYSSVPTDSLLRTLENEFNKILREIQTMERNQRIDDEGTRGHLCHIMRETEDKLNNFNCEMSKTRRDEKARREKTVDDLRYQLKKQEETAASLNATIGSYEGCNRQLRDSIAALKEEKRALADENLMLRDGKKSETNKTSSQYMVLQAQTRENKTDDKQSNMKREEKERLEKTVADLKEQLKKKEETLKSLNVSIESTEKNNRQLKESIAALEAKKMALAEENLVLRNAGKKTEPDKTSSQHMVLQAQKLGKKTDDKQSNTTRDEKARHEKTVADLKEELKEREGTAKTQNTRIESIERDKRQLMECIAALEREKRALAEEKDSYVLRLSKLAGQRLVDDNPAIADLSDPNRPMKLGEMYSEIYDNEWTCALDALMKAGYDETEAIYTLLLTLLNILDYCKSKSDKLLEKTEDAVNFLFKEIKDSEDKKPKKHLTITKSQRNQFLNLKNDSLRDAQPGGPINLPERWIPKKRGQKNTAQSFETVKVKKPDGVAKRLTLFRKEVAESMVPIVQKAYMAASWEDGMFIPELKPFIKKCIFLGWMMVVQAPPMALVACQEGEPLDKNMFKEYTKSGPEVDYLVWPALQLHERGPLIGKGIAQGRGKQMKQNKNNTQF